MKSLPSNDRHHCIATRSAKLGSSKAGTTTMGTTTTGAATTAATSTAPSIRGSWGSSHQVGGAQSPSGNARGNIAKVSAHRLGMGSNAKALSGRYANEELHRRRGGVVAMSVIASLAYYVLRVGYDSLFAIGVEIAIGAVLIALLTFLFRGTLSTSVDRQAVTKQNNESAGGRVLLYGAALSLILLAFPAVLDLIFRRMGAGNGREILMLSSLAWGALGLAFSAPTVRAQSLSAVASGFLVMFSTFISDEGRVVAFVYIWIAICLWWLLNNHWSAVQCLAASEVKRSHSSRWFYLLCGVGLFLCVTVAVWDRVPVLRKLQTEIMPTSGGTSQEDSVARSGVGNGDALVAAQNHATSFGPVETDLFLDSEKPSLFDVFSDEFGEPKVKERVERAQALSPNDIQSNDGEFSEANRSSGGNEFSIERERPKVIQRSEDLKADSLMYWEGASGIRLATMRYTNFDGTTWRQSEGQVGDGMELPVRRKTVELRAVEIDDRTWFAPRSKAIQNAISPFVDSVPETLKFTRFRSPEIPVRAGAQMWSIDKITLMDFFGYSLSDSLFMPDRQHVPDYTVVRFVDSQIDRERVESLLRNCAPGRYHSLDTTQCATTIAELSHHFADDAPRGLEQVERVIDGLRSDFEFARVAASPKDEQSLGDSDALERFLATKQGPSYLFATAAALMLDHLGYETRLVSGFYVSTEHYDAAERATAILPEDAHVWLEVHSGHGYWIPLEPTPGFRKPKLKSSLWYLAQKNWKSLVAGISIAAALLFGVYLSRAQLFAAFCWVSFPLIHCLPTRRRLSWLCWMLDMRWALIGFPRESSQTQRRRLREIPWRLDPTSLDSISTFLDVVDSVRFGGGNRGAASNYSLSYTVLKHIHSIQAPPKLSLTDTRA